jgi:hypothetical protein
MSKAGSNGDVPSLEDAEVEKNVLQHSEEHADDGKIILKAIKPQEKDIATAGSNDESSM